ncbi:MAG: penicillin-binding protein activator LpoB [Proteobacteria bacterium]|nr:penicillin-binding protein activator LpoB [Pseudomonadota bacterium]
MHPFTLRSPRVQTPRLWLGAILTLLLAACATTAVPTQSLQLQAGDSLAVLPFENATEVPQAETRVQAIAVALVRQKGMQQVLVYPQSPSDNPLEAPAAVTPVQTLDWARRKGAHYALSGTVTEWRYKTGVDSEPAVGLTLQITDVGTGQVVWSATGARAGWGYQALAAVGQAQLADLLRGVHVVTAPAKVPVTP